LTQARERLRFAKDRWTHASVSVLKAEPGAESLATAALAELTAARAELQRLLGAPPAVGVWAESARLIAETQRC
jgi:hypothetical protein